MPCLTKATDHMLLREGLISLAPGSSRSPVLHPFACGIRPEHDWSKTQTDIADEPPYQFCRDCGAVRASPWKPD